MRRPTDISGALDEGRVTFERRHQPALKDPVCGMEIWSDGAAATSEYQGRVYSFCSTACKREFDAHPERYAAEAPPPHSER